jgi:hypothetical protein
MVNLKENHWLRLSVQVALLVLSWVLIITPSYGRDYKFTDAHLHYVNYVLQSENFPNLFEEMDKNRIERVVVFGLGYAVSWPDMRPARTKYYADPEVGLDNTQAVYLTKMGDYRLLMDYARLSPQQKARIYPFLQAINVTDRNEIYYMQKMFGYHPELCGIGELTIRQGDLNRLTFQSPSGDSVVLDPILDFAAANRMPVLIHQDLAEAPSNSPAGLADPLYLKEITDLLTRHPDATVIWAHGGLSRNIQVKDYLTLLKRLLIAHLNLYFDLSWVVWENNIAKDLNGWADLIMAHPDRFLIGSDKIGNFKGKKSEKLSEPWSRFLSSQATDTGLGDTLKAYAPLLQELDQRPDGEAVADMITYRNMNWILSRIKNGCKTGKLFVDPWKGADPWKDPRYTRPVLTVKLAPEFKVPISLCSNLNDLRADIRAKYYGGIPKHDYTGLAEGMTMALGKRKQGVALFSAPGFRNYTGYVDGSRQESFPVQSLFLIDDWDEVFSYENKGVLFYPNGNWPTVPWWKDESGVFGRIDKVKVPEGKRLYLYADEYFRGDVLRTILPTQGKYESLGDVAERVKSFQFVPEVTTLPTSP